MPSAPLRIAATVVAGCLTAWMIPPAQAHQEQSAVLAVADQALDRISAEDSVGLTDLMIPDAVLYRGSFQDGHYQVRVISWAEARAMAPRGDVVERGFNPTVLVTDTTAMVWYPYDYYLDGKWSHCGVDTFNLVRTDDGWKIATMTWSVEQPPACQRHPDGPPVAPQKVSNGAAGT